MGNYRKIIYFVLFVILTTSVFGITSNVTYFSDGTTRFNTTVNLTKYFQLPINSTIINATISLQGLDDMNRFNSINATTSGKHCDNISSGTCADTDDGNWSSAMGIDSSIPTYSVYQNFSVPSGVKKANITYKHSGSRKYVGDQTHTCFDLEFKNSSGEWEVIFNDDPCYEGDKTSIVGVDEVIENFTTLEFRWGSIKTLQEAYNFYESNITFYETQYPENIFLKINNTQVYNLATNLTGLNESRDLNTSLVQSFLTVNESVPLSISSTFGKLELYSLFVEYNVTNLAVLSFNNPSAELKISSIGGNHLVEVTLENTGNYNATNCFFRTVSTGTPNYNNKLSYDIFSVNDYSNTSVFLTVTDISENSEDDEKLQYYCIGTEENHIIYSELIDFDLTYTFTPDPGSGGGGQDQQAQLKFDIVGTNAFNQNTAQLSIRPSDDRDFCLDVLNKATVTQSIKIECEQPKDAVKNACDWTNLYCPKESLQLTDYTCEQTDTYLILSIQPSEETRARFCMNISTPVNILIGERHVVNIKGTTTDPGELRGAIDKHTITMWVTDPILFFSDLGEKLGQTNVAEAFYQALNKYVKTGVNEEIRNIPNILNPLFLFVHVLFFILVTLMFKKASFVLHSAVQIALLVFDIIALYYPTMLLFTYIVIFVLYGWLALMRLVFANKTNIKKAKATT